MDRHTFKQNATEPFVIFLDDESDNKTGVTGLAASIASQLAKNGGTLTTVSPTIVEIGNGWYRVTPIAAHRDTTGPAVWRFTASGANSVELAHRIVATDTAAELISYFETQARAKGGHSVLSVLELIQAAVMGKASTPSETTELFKYQDDTDAFTVFYDDDHNRTNVTIH